MEKTAEYRLQDLLVPDGSPQSTPERAAANVPAVPVNIGYCNSDVGYTAGGLSFDSCASCFTFNLGLAE